MVVTWVASIFIKYVKAELIRESRNIGWTQVWVGYLLTGRSGKFEALGWQLCLLEKLRLILQDGE